MCEPVVVTAKYSVEDWARGNTFPQQRIFLFKYSWLVAGQLVLLALVAFFFIDPYAFASAFFNTFGAIFIALIPIISAVQYFRGRHKIPRSTMMKTEKKVAETPVMQHPHTVTFSKAGIASTTPISSGNIDWSAVIEVAETDDDLYFFTGKRTAMYIPKWALAKGDDYVRVKEMISSSKLAN